MTTLGIIGSGNIGGTVARLAVAAGHDVVLSNSRGPETLADLVAQIGPRARAATSEEAARAGDLVLVSIPLLAWESIPVAPLAGKVVLDTMNYYPERDGEIAPLVDKSLTGSGLLQQHLPDSHAVKVFNSIFFKHLLNLARPAGAADRSALAIAGDDAGAKATATAFLDTLGYDAFDAGSLVESWRLEPDRAAYGTPYLGADDEHGTPADASVLRPLIEDAGPR